MENKFFIAFHCVPYTVEPAVEKFWSLASENLKKAGHTLLMVTTTPLSDPSLTQIAIPFKISDFYNHADEIPQTITNSDHEISDVMAWHHCNYQVADASLKLSKQFFYKLIDTLQPVGMIGWQSMNPMTRTVRNVARARDIPFWSAERGWLRDTLMFDLVENNFLSEVQTSFALSYLASNYQASGPKLAELDGRMNGITNQSRYSTKTNLTREEFRKKYHIAEDELCFILLTHGEPHLNSIHTDSIRKIHQISREKLETISQELISILHARQIKILIQEHPFNVNTPHAIKLPSELNHIKISESVNSLIAGGDRFLFTLSTIQFDVAMSGKPMGLLCKSPLYEKNAIPLISDFGSTGLFLDALISTNKLYHDPSRIKNRLAFLSEYFLFDIQKTHIDSSAQRFADHLLELSF